MAEKIAHRRSFTMLRLQIIASLMLASMLALLPAAPAGHAQEGRISIGDVMSVIDGINYLNLRSQPGTDSDILAELQPGTVLRVTSGPQTADGYTWWKVEGNGVKGWTAAQFLQLRPRAANPIRMVTLQWRDGLNCKRTEQFFQGIEYCTAKIHQAIHVIVIDLHSQGVRLEYIMPVGYDGDGEFGECRDVNRASKQLGGPGCDAEDSRELYPVMTFETAKKLAETRFPQTAVVVNSDYGAKASSENPSENPVEDRDHGPEGFTVVKGERLDGKLLGDGDNNAEKRPWLAVSENAPLRAEFSQFESGQDDGYAPDWIHTAVGGAPWLIKKGKILDASISECAAARPDSCRKGAKQTAAGISADGRWLFLIADERKGDATLLELAQFMSSDLAVQDAIKFDGGGSTQLSYNGDDKTTGNTRQLSQYLAVIAPPGQGITTDLPIRHASPLARVFYDIVLPGEMAELTIRLRNEGQTIWKAESGYQLKRISGALPDAPETLSLDGLIPPGEVATWTISLPGSTFGAPRWARYQMHYDGEPFGDIAVYTVIILPEKLQELEADIRGKIEEILGQEDLSIDDLPDLIWQLIQEEIKKQSATLPQKIWDMVTGIVQNACNSILGLFGLTLIAMYQGRRKRQP